MVPGFLIRSLSDHYNSPGRLAEYKRQFQRVVRRPRDDPSIFAIELETLARRAFIDIDIPIQLQMVRDRLTGGVCTPHTFGQFGTRYSHGRHGRLLSGVGKSPGCGNRTKDERG